jgi:hypothetical protein
VGVDLFTHREIPCETKTASTPSQCNYTYKFHIDIQGRKVYVCRKFLVATLNLSKKKIWYTVQDTAEMNTGKTDERGKVESCVI